MERLSPLIRITIIFCLSLLSYKSYSIDIVKIKDQQLSKNKAAHNIAVIQRALEITEPNYGPFMLETVNIRMTPEREIRIVEEGDIVNVTITPANQYWDTYLTPIKVPIRLGLLSYRLLLINKVDLPKFEQIATINEIKQTTVGLLHNWKTAGIYKENKISMMKSYNYEGLFLMLNNQRFDYIPRAIYEVYDELEAQESILKDIVVEPTIALFIPTKTYLYVSPKNKRLVKRLQSGLHELVTSGELKEILHKYYASDIKRAKLNKRKMITIESRYYNQTETTYNEYLLN